MKCCSLLERWPVDGGGGNLFPTAAEGNALASKGFQDFCIDPVDRLPPWCPESFLGEPHAPCLGPLTPLASAGVDHFCPPRSEGVQSLAGELQEPTPI
jgi:hypothetical protein